MNTETWRSRGYKCSTIELCHWYWLCEKFSGETDWYTDWHWFTLTFFALAHQAQRQVSQRQSVDGKREAISCKKQRQTCYGLFTGTSHFCKHFSFSCFLLSFASSLAFSSLFTGFVSGHIFFVPSDAAMHPSSAHYTLLMISCFCGINTGKKMIRTIDAARYERTWQRDHSNDCHLFLCQNICCSMSYSHETKRFPCRGELSEPGSSNVALFRPLLDQVPSVPLAKATTTKTDTGTSVMNAIEREQTNNILYATTKLERWMIVASIKMIRCSRYQLNWLNWGNNRDKWNINHHQIIDSLYSFNMHSIHIEPSRVETVKSALFRHASYKLFSPRENYNILKELIIRLSLLTLNIWNVSE